MFKRISLFKVSILIILVLLNCNDKKKIGVPCVGVGQDNSKGFMDQILGKADKDKGAPLECAAALSLQQGQGVPVTGTTYSIGGSITGLTTSGLVLQNNLADDLTVASGATTFTFATQVSGAYSVTVKTQPTGLTCAVSNGNGTASANVTNASISCTSGATTYSIGGNITGLTASGLVLQNNLADDLTVASGATTFTFATQVSGAYSVTVKTQPTGLTCTVSNGNGTASTNVNNVSISCATGTGTAATYTIGGTITGLTASGLVLQNNLADDLTVANGASTFTFATQSSTYSVTVKTQPTGLTCLVSSETGTATANVTNVSISCTSGVTLVITGGVTTPYGPAQGTSIAGDTDGTGNAARFNNPQGIVSDGPNLYVAEFNNNKIRKINISTGAVTTFVGPAQGTTTSGDTDATGNAARFNMPVALAIDSTNLYVADWSGNKIRKVVLSTGVVTTIGGPAPGANTSGDTDATGNASRFNQPVGIAIDSTSTNLYVTEQGNNKIRKIVLATGVVTTPYGPAQGTITAGNADGTGNAARFSWPTSIVVDKTTGQNLYVADRGNNKIRKIVIASGVVTSPYGPAAGTTTSGDADGTGNAARFNQPNGVEADGTYLYIADLGNHKIRKITIATGVVATIAGPLPGTVQSGDTNGSVNAARFYYPSYIYTDGTSLYVTDYQTNKIRRIQ
jgi:hypothetical protein